MTPTRILLIAQRPNDVRWRDLIGRHDWACDNVLARLVEHVTCLDAWLCRVLPPVGRWWIDGASG
jgi:hypothetical protein